LAVTVGQNSHPALVRPIVAGEQGPWHPSGSQDMPGPSQAKVSVRFPVASQTTARPNEQMPAFGTQVTHPRPSLHSLVHRST